MSKNPTTLSPAAASDVAAALVPREPYVSPVIEKFPPMTEVSFGTNIQPTSAQTIAFP